MELKGPCEHRGSVENRLKLSVESINVRSIMTGNLTVREGNGERGPDKVNRV